MYISIEATRWAWTESLSERSARLVLLAIAAHCNEDGYAWPSLETIMALCKLSKGVVLEAIQKLAEHKEITVEKGGHGAGDTNRYYLLAFMLGRVGKGTENLDKGSVSPEKGYTRVDTNKNLEEEHLEGAIPNFQERIKTVSQRLEDYYRRRWQTDEQGKRYLISPSSGERIYEASA